MRHLWIAALLCAAATTFTKAADAQQCGNLVRAISLDLEDNVNYFTVPVTVNDTPRKFLLDTGGTFSQISVDIVKEMGLRIQPSRFMFYDMYGNQSAGQVLVDIGIGRQTVKNNETQVIGIHGVDGIFAADFMQNYDIDIDFAGKKLNYFLTDHCDGRVIYWPAGVVASVPFHGWNTHSASQMSVAVKLDGHELTATVDTGATDSTLDAGTAHQLFDLSADSPGAEPMGTMGATHRKVFGFSFKTLEIGGLTIRDPKLAVIPDLIGKNDNSNIEADSHIRRITDGMGPTMLIGMDILRKLHMYIAFKEGKLYLTAGSDQTTQRTPVQPPAAAKGN
ncbi:MAG: aspartyl protease family protein [Alphaproteobacteria bacterium]|nr:aspartyl protease family protein [Alphaproteobacteria bacterium]